MSSVSSLNLDEIHLVSFDICPFVQRAMIVLLEKNVDFRVSYIDLARKPDWFLKMSPLGKVPILDVGGTILFESAVICEYLDETHGHALHPPEPLRKAKHRAWMEFSSVLLTLIYQMNTAQSAGELAPKRNELHQKLRQLEAEIVGPFFDGAKFSLVDAFFAPIFRYIQTYEMWGDKSYLSDFPKISEWSSQTLRRGSVIKSAPEDYVQKLMNFLIEKNSFYLTKFKSL